MQMSDGLRGVLDYYRPMENSHIPNKAVLRQNKNSPPCN